MYWLTRVSFNFGINMMRKLFILLPRSHFGLQSDCKWPKWEVRPLLCGVSGTFNRTCPQDGGEESYAWPRMERDILFPREISGAIRNHIRSATAMISPHSVPHLHHWSGWFYARIPPSLLPFSFLSSPLLLLSHSPLLLLFFPSLFSPLRSSFSHSYLPPSSFSPSIIINSSYTLHCVVHIHTWLQLNEGRVIQEQTAIGPYKRAVQ